MGRSNTARWTLAPFAVALLAIATTGQTLAQTSPAPLTSPAPSAGGGAPQSAAAAVCDPFLTQTEASAILGPAPLVQGVDFRDITPPLRHVLCSWRPTGRPQVDLEVQDLMLGPDGHFLVEKFRQVSGGTALGGLGDVAYSGTEFPGNFVGWAITKDGDIDRTLSISGGATPMDQLTALAHAVRADATPGTPPVSPVASGVPTDAGPIDPAIVGDWVLTAFGGDTPRAAPQSPTVNLHLGADGALTYVIDCKPKKGQKPPTFKSTFTTSGDTLTIADGTIRLSCRSSSAQDFSNGLWFITSMAINPSSTYGIVGDTLTITGTQAPGTLVFRRATAP
jgi:hypothetical protein